MRKRRSRRKRRVLRLIRITIFVVLLAVIAVGLRMKVEKQEAEEKRQAELQLAKEQEEKIAREKKEREDKIEAALAQEEYETELRAIYAEHPDFEEVLLNREKYPDWVIEYLAGHDEVYDWVIDYPVYSRKKEEELWTLSEEPISENEESQNNVPLLLQWDHRWGYLTYGRRPIALEGCGPTCLSMAVIGLTGDRSITPSVVAKYSMENGFYVEEAGTSWSLMVAGAEHFGLRSRQITTWSTTVIKNVLKAGDVVVCSVGEGDFTSRGHFILLVGLNEDGSVIVNDPNSRENSKKSWDIKKILDQTKGIWQIGV